MGDSRFAKMVVVAALVTTALLIVGQWNASGPRVPSASQEGSHADPTSLPTNTPLPTSAVSIQIPSDLDVARMEAWNFYDAVIAPKVDVQEVHARKMSEVEWLGVASRARYPLTPGAHYYIFAFSSTEDVKYTDFMPALADPVNPITGESLGQVTPDAELEWFYLATFTDHPVVAESGGLSSDADGFPPRLDTLLETGIALERPER